MAWNLFVISIALFGCSSAVLNKRSYSDQQGYYSGLEYGTYEDPNSPLLQYNGDIYNPYDTASERLVRNPQYHDHFHHHHHHNRRGYGYQPPQPNPFHNHQQPSNPFQPQLQEITLFPGFPPIQVPKLPQLPMLPQLPGFPQIPNFNQQRPGFQQFPGNGNNNWNGHGNNPGHTGCIGFCDMNSQKHPQPQPHPQPKPQPHPQPKPQPQPQPRPQPQPQPKPQPQPQPKNPAPNNDLIGTVFGGITEAPEVNNGGAGPNPPSKGNDLIHSTFAGLGPDGNPKPTQPSKGNDLIQSTFAGLGPDGKPKTPPTNTGSVQPNQPDKSTTDLIQSIFNPNTPSAAGPNPKNNNEGENTTIPPSTTNSEGLIYDIDVRSS